MANQENAIGSPLGSESARPGEQVEIDDLTAADIQALINELQAQKFEPQRQNEVLQQANY